MNTKVIFLWERRKKEEGKKENEWEWHKSEGGRQRGRKEGKKHKRKAKRVEGDVAHTCNRCT
jgi:hypothetical protein